MPRCVLPSFIASHDGVDTRKQFNNPPGTDTFVAQTPNYGPLVPRLVLADMIGDPLFTVRRDSAVCSA